MVEECICSHYRADHSLNADQCAQCGCRKFRLGKLVDVRAQLADARAENEKLRVNIGESGLVIEQQDRDFDKLVAERDAAIERGVELWEVLYHYTLHSSTVRRLLEQAEAKINKLRPSGWGQV